MLAIGAIGNITVEHIDMFLLGNTLHIRYLNTTLQSVSSQWDGVFILSKLLVTCREVLMSHTKTQYRQIKRYKSKYIF
jgi:hypothetical protein